MLQGQVSGADAMGAPDDSSMSEVLPESLSDDDEVDISPPTTRFLSSPGCTNTDNAS
jgi:hypothetical protein